MLSLTGLTNAQIDEIYAQNQLRRQVLLEKYQAKYPDAYISRAFLRDIGYAVKENSQCKGCLGDTCHKVTNKFIQQRIVAADDGSLDIRGSYCKYYKAIQAQNLANQQFNRAKIPPMYIGKTFGHYSVDANNQNAVNWAKRFESLYLCGSPGTGKTFLAAIMAQELLKQGKSVIFGDVPTLLDQLKGTFDNDADSTLEELMQTLASVDVLILDDLGTGATCSVVKSYCA